MQNERIGDYFTSVSGRKIYVADPRPEDIHLFDITVGLSNVCRFGGQVLEHYSVLQHSKMVVRGVIMELLGIDAAAMPEYDFWCKVRKMLLSVSEGDLAKILRTAALHDGSEAYIGDMVKPMKMMGLMEEYRRIEAKWDGVLAEKYDLFYPLPDIVKRHDNRALATEFRDLRPNCDDLNWKCKPEEPYEWVAKAQVQGPIERRNFAVELLCYGIDGDVVRGAVS
jgi:hypothetical protein